MEESSTAYLPRDRLDTLAAGLDLPRKAQGSVLFADISGFTPLTEAFERHLGSRKGGEKLTLILNDAYASLIGEVERMRGSVIGFAGDAITCWFDGDDGLRAVNAGLAMQAGMKAFAAIPSPDGSIMALGLKAAVSSGQVQRFVVGRPELQRVDILAGDPVYRVAEVEQAAEKGEVLVDAQTREALGDKLSIIGERQDETGKPKAWVVQDSVPARDVEPWPDLGSITIDADLLNPWMIAAIRERLHSGMGDFFTELRPATTLFMKFDGIDYEEDEAADEKLDLFFSEIQEIVTRLGGVVHQLTLGDKGSFLYAAFGAPVSHEDDTSRTMAAAIEMRRIPEKFPFISNVQIGIGRGTTRTGAYGGPTRRTYGVLGDQVNLAARLMGKAANGQILVSESAWREGRKSYLLQALDPVMVKGKTDPIPIYSLEKSIQEAGSMVRPLRYAMPMVGRKAELSGIKKALDKAHQSKGQVVSIIAEAGMGKTRLSAEALKAAEKRGFMVLRGECQTFGTNTQYTPWWTIWRTFLGLGAEVEAEDAVNVIRARLKKIDHSLVPRYPLMGAVLNIPIQDNELTRTFDQKVRMASLESLLVECLRSEAQQHPLVIVIEDCHALDPVSRDLLRMLIQASARLPVCFLLLHRPVETGAILGKNEEILEYVQEMELGEFTLEESRKWIRTKFGQLFGRELEVPDAVVSLIAERTGGNPFFIEEVMNWTTQQEIDINSPEAFDSAELPVSLYSLVLSRMDQLDERSRISMKVASVIGRLFQASVVWGIYPELGDGPVVTEALEKLVQNQFTMRQGSESQLEYLFRHVVIHEVAYESLTHELRERMHESIALFVESNITNKTPQVLDQLAFHYGRSANKEKQREYFLLAGEASLASYANTNAARHFEALIPLLEEAQRPAINRKLGGAIEFGGDYETAMQRYKEALEIATIYKNDSMIAYLKHDIGDLLRKTGAFEEAREWLEAAREAFNELQDEGGYGQALHSSGTLAAQTGNYTEARTLYTQSMEIRRKLGDDAKVASLLSNVGIIQRFQGKLDEALGLQEESLSIREGLNDPWAIGNSLNNLGMAKRYKGDLEGARKDLERSLLLLKKVGDRAEIANTLNSLAEVAIDQQDTDSCEAFLKESLELTRDLGNLRAIAFLFEAFASNAFFQKRPQRCLKLFGAAAALRESIGAPLPDADLARIEETIDLAGQALDGGEPAPEIEEGARMALSEALEFAADSKG